MKHAGTAMPEAMMEKAVSPMNWEAALYAVERNDGAPGSDGMRAKELRAHLEKNGRTIKERLLEGSYRPGAARRKDIAKPNGGTRPLSIPNVQDRFVQHLLLGVMQPIFEERFSESSHGFRPMRSAHGAVKTAQAHAQAGNTYVVDLDITKFFDRVNHDILMSKIGAVIGDKRILQIIGRFLRAGVVMPDGIAVHSEEGTPQGGPLSPLLANIYLDALDKELEKRGLKFVRYADDCNIYVSSEKAAKRAKENITAWLKSRLRLEVNESKSGVGRPWERKFLGFTLTVTLAITIASSSLVKFKDRVRELWDARQSKSSVELRNRWASYVQGWWGLLSLRSTPAGLPTAGCLAGSALPAERMETPDLRHRRVDTKTHPMLLLAKMAQQRRTTSGPPANGSASGASQNGSQQQRSMGNGKARGDERSVEQQNAQEMGVQNAITTWEIKFPWF